LSEQPQGREKLYWLMSLLAADDHDAGTFCKEFERTYNFEVDRTILTPTERDVFKSVFDKVCWYSPFPDERKKIPQYVSGEQIRTVVREAQTTLGVS
jgi:hypothetical protein